MRCNCGTDSGPMSPRSIRTLFACAIALVLLIVPASAPAATRGPSSKLMRKLITERFDAQYRESWMEADDLKIEIKTFRRYAARKRKLTTGPYAVPVRVWPLRANVLITIDRSPNYGIDTTKRGWWHTDYPGGHEVFYFHRDSTNHWTWVTGGP